MVGSENNYFAKKIRSDVVTKYYWQPNQESEPIRGHFSLVEYLRWRPLAEAISACMLWARKERH